MSVLPDSKVHFNVGVSGTPPLNFMWFRNQKELTASSDLSIIRDCTSSSLRLLMVKPLDSGLYACHINNDVGSASCQASLFVKGPHCFLTSSLFFWADVPAEFTFVLCVSESAFFVDKPEGVSVVRTGDRQVFQCRVGGSPEITVRCFRHGAEIHQNVKHNLLLVHSVAMLEISQVSESDCGNYFCQASNEVGTESFAVEL